MGTEYEEEEVLTFRTLTSYFRTRRVDDVVLDGMMGSISDDNDIMDMYILTSHSP